MTEPNTEKQQRYAVLKAKLKKALANEFWLEACMIEYAIIEDRTSSILHYSKVCLNAYDESKKLSNKLNSIEYQIGKGHPIISKKVSKDLIAEIKVWKDERNDMVHRACKCYDENLAKEVAEKGKVLTDKITNDSKKVTNLAKKMYGGEN